MDGKCLKRFGLIHIVNRPIYLKKRPKMFLVGPPMLWSTSKDKKTKMPKWFFSHNSAAHDPTHFKNWYRRQPDLIGLGQYSSSGGRYSSCVSNCRFSSWFSRL